jgi:hypothetical protein
MRLAVTARRAVAVIRNTTPELANQLPCDELHIKLAAPAGTFPILNPPERERESRE